MQLGPTFFKMTFLTSVSAREVAEGFELTSRSCVNRVPWLILLLYFRKEKGRVAWLALIPKIY